jgi:hypothetical protein
MLGQMVHRDLHRDFGVVGVLHLDLHAAEQLLRVEAVGVHAIGKTAH